MAQVTIKGPSSGAVKRLLIPRVYTADSWGSEWDLQTDAIFKSAVVKVASEGISQLEFELPYGDAISAIEGPPFRSVDPQDLQGSWARLDLVDEDGAAQVVFVGQIRGEDRTIMGSKSNGPTGFQKFTAFGGGILLSLCAISHSFWTAPPASGGGSTQTSGGVVEVEWSPDFNVQDRLGFLVGNRSSSQSGASFVFGGRDKWTRLDALNYVVARFLTKLKGPTWTLGGQLDALSLPVENVPIGLTTTAEDLLRKLLPREAGLDYVVLPNSDDEGVPTGFEIRVFSLFGSNVQFNGAQLSGNKSLISLDANDTDLSEVHVTTDTTSLASKVRVLGARIVLCATLLGSNGPGASGTTSDPTSTGSFGPLWTPTQETAYKLGLGDGDGTPLAHAVLAPQNDALREALTTGVYQKFGPAATFVMPAAWLPAFDGNGELAGGSAPYQNKVRELLDWIPIIGEDGRPQKCLVIARDRKAEIASSPVPVSATPPAPIWNVINHLGVSVSVPPNAFALELTTKPPHRLARGMFKLGDAGTSSSEFNPADDLEEHAIDPTTIAATVAWHMDQRLSLEATISGAVDDGTVYEVPAHHPEHAELWVVAAGTITDVINGQPYSAAKSLSVVRNDSDRLASFMAGVVARYLFGRQRAVVTYHGWKPRLDLIGQILQTVEQGGQTHGVNAPITSVELQGGMNVTDVKTIVRAGFAGAPS